MLIRSFTILILAATICFSTDEPVIKPLPTAVQSAISKNEQDVETAYKLFRKSAEKSRDSLIVILEKQAQAEGKNGNLDQALAIKTRILEIKGDKWISGVVANAQKKNGDVDSLLGDEKKPDQLANNNTPVRNGPPVNQVPPVKYNGPITILGNWKQNGTVRWEILEGGTGRHFNGGTEWSIKWKYASDTKDDIEVSGAGPTRHIVLDKNRAKELVENTTTYLTK